MERKCDFGAGLCVDSCINKDEEILFVIMPAIPGCKGSEPFLETTAVMGALGGKILQTDTFLLRMFESELLDVFDTNSYNCACMFLTAIL